MAYRVFLESFLMIFLAEMGDKSQFLMVALTAHYRKRDILLSSFAAVVCLNLLAVFVGGAVGRYLPASFVSLVAGFAFLAFAKTAMGESGDTGEKLCRTRYAFPTIFGTYFLAELGDKTQLSALALSASGNAPWMIFAGATAGLFLSGVLGLLVGAFFGKRFSPAFFSRVSCLLFFVCGTARIYDGWEGLLAASSHPTLYAILATLPPLFLFVILLFKERSAHEATHASLGESVPLQRQQ